MGIKTNECYCEVLDESDKQTGIVIEGQTATETNKSYPAMSLQHP